MSKPRVVKSGHLCKSCGAWVGVENHGTYCKADGVTRDEMTTCDFKTSGNAARISALESENARLKSRLERADALAGAMDRMLVSHANLYTAEFEHHANCDPDNDIVRIEAKRALAAYRGDERGG